MQARLELYAKKCHGVQLIVQRNDSKHPARVSRNISIQHKTETVMKGHNRFDHDAAHAAIPFPTDERASERLTWLY